LSDFVKDILQIFPAFLEKIVSFSFSHHAGERIFAMEAETFPAFVKRGCRTIKYFLLGGSPALCPNGGEIGCDFAPIPYKHSSFPDIPFGMPDFKLFCFQPLKSMLSLMKKDDSPFFQSESCNEAY